MASRVERKRLCGVNIVSGMSTAGREKIALSLRRGSHVGLIRVYSFTLDDTLMNRMYLLEKQQ